LSEIKRAVLSATSRERGVHCSSQGYQVLEPLAYGAEILLGGEKDVAINGAVRSRNQPHMPRQNGSAAPTGGRKNCNILNDQQKNGNPSLAGVDRGDPRFCDNVGGKLPS